jgi:hypothetical protein
VVQTNIRICENYLVFSNFNTSTCAAFTAPQASVSPYKARATEFSIHASISNQRGCTGVDLEYFNWAAKTFLYSFTRSAGASVYFFSAGKPASGTRLERSKAFLPAVKNLISFSANSFFCDA